MMGRVGFLTTTTKLNYWREIEMAELKPCPFCGGNATVVEHIYYGFQNKYGVVCLECYAETGQFMCSKDLAEDAWNRRAREDG